MKAVKGGWSLLEDNAEATNLVRERSHGSVFNGVVVVTVGRDGEHLLFDARDNSGVVPAEDTLLKAVCLRSDDLDEFFDRGRHDCSVTSGNRRRWRGLTVSDGLDDTSGVHVRRQVSIDAVVALSALDLLRNARARSAPP